MDTGLTPRTLRRCMLRSSMLNIAYNARGLQSIGFLYSIMPGLRELYPDDEDFAKSCARYSRHFNCHVLWGPFICGAFLNVEQQIARGIIGSEVIEALKEPTLNSLSAVGDSFISGSLLPFLMLMLACLIILGSPHLVWVILLATIVFSIIVKIISFYLGMARGFVMLNSIRRLNLVNRGDYLKIINGILLATFLALALSNPLDMAGSDLNWQLVLHTWFLPVAIMMLLSYAVARIHLSRSLALAVMIIGTSIFI